MHEKERAAPKEAALQALVTEFKGTAASVQRQRLQRAFELVSKLNTTEIRRWLDILHPAGRVKELRAEGVDIQTLWTTIESERGVKHRVADYLLIRGAGDA